jgi:hypothetical protein
MALAVGIKALHPSAVANRPHVVGFDTARTAAHDTLFEIWNGATGSAIKAAVDKDGKLYSAALTAGDLLYAVTGGVSGVKRLDSLAIGAANTVLTSSGSVPQWSTALSLAGTLSAAGLVTASAGLTVASGQTLTLTGATVAGAPTWSSTQSLNTSGNAGTATALQTARTINGTSFNGTANITVAAAAGTLTGVALASNVVGSVLTSVGTLTSLTSAGIVRAPQFLASSVVSLQTVNELYYANFTITNTGGGSPSSRIDLDMGGTAPMFNLHDAGGQTMKLAIGGVQVLTAQQEAIADAIGLNSFTINQILTALRNHGLIAT